MRLDDRIVEGSRVLVSRRFEAEVIAIPTDRLTCQVRPIPKVVPPPYEPEDGDDEQGEASAAPPSAPPMLVKWHEVKLSEDHL
jgi:hypothetical protein